MALIMSPKLLCLYPWLSPGGADKFNLDMLAQLRARGWQATVVTTLPHTHSWEAQYRRVCDDIVHIGEAAPAEQPARMLQLIGERRPDAVLTSNSNLGYNLLPYLRAHFPEIAFLDYCHAVDPDSPTGGYPYTSVSLSNALDLQIVSSQTLRAWMCARGGDGERIAVCSTNIDPADWSPARYDRRELRAALGIPEGALVGLFAARLERVKQPPLAAEIMRRVVSQVPDAFFLIAGDGTYAGFMRSFVRAHRLEAQVKMLGMVSNQRMRELLALSDILLLPSQMEGLSLAIYEAMAMGVVPVSVNAGGQAELVTPECGLLIGRGTGDEATAYTNALLGLARDRKQLQRMGKAARQRVSEQFRLDQMGDRMHELLLRARTLHDSEPRPAISAAVAQESARRAIVEAERDATWARSTTSSTTLRSRVRALYWELVAHGAWWLVPLGEWLRR